VKKDFSQRPQRLSGEITFSSKRNASGLKL
jgi:hypothetical protein